MFNDCLIERRVVAFEGQQVVTLPVDDLLRNLGVGQAVQFVDELIDLAECSQGLR